jgi:tRNA G18 (ribose-2'-O)-methylase SpoU
VSLPTTGPVKSLNVSVATGVVLFEALRQRHSKRNPRSTLG